MHRQYEDDDVVYVMVITPASVDLPVETAMIKIERYRLIASRMATLEYSHS